MRQTLGVIKDLWQAIGEKNTHTQENMGENHKFNKQKKSWHSREIAPTWKTLTDQALAKQHWKDKKAYRLYSYAL